MTTETLETQGSAQVPGEESQKPPTAGPAPETEGLVAQATGATESGQAGATEGETGEGSAPVFNAESLLAEVTGKKPVTPAAEEKLPGKSLAEVEAGLKQQRAAAYGRVFMPQTEQAVVAKLQRELSLSEEESKAVWSSAIQPFLNSLHANNEDFNAVVNNAAVRAALSEKEAELYFSREYPDRLEGFKGLVATGARLKDEEWQAKVNKGELISRADAATAIDRAFNAGQVQAAKTLEAAQSGENITGRTGSTKAYKDMTAAERAALSPEERDRLVAQQYRR